MVSRAASLFDSGEPAGAEANIAKLLAADVSWEAANATLQSTSQISIFFRGTAEELATDNEPFGLTFVLHETSTTHNEVGH